MSLQDEQNVFRLLWTAPNSQ